MARNKYPEVTEERILDVAQRLFLEKGYENTTIQDIVNTARTNMTAQSIPMNHNPRVLVGMIDANRRILTPYFLELIEEGNRDGSIHTEYAKEIAELLPLLTSLWLLPSVFPATKEEMRRKFSFIGEMMEKMGVPLFDDTIQRLVDEFFEQIPDLK